MSACLSQNWYGDLNRTRDIAKEAYDEAIRDLKAEFQDEQPDSLSWVGSHTSIEDVQDSISHAQKRYQDATQFSFIRNRLRKASEIILFYGTALDVLAQQHPEYVSLAWGTIKFIFIGIISHGELVSEFSKALVDVGEILPRAKLHAELYQTDMMRDAVSGLYRQILLFLRKALQWYQCSRARRAIYAIVRPFKLDLKNTVDEVRKCVVTMEAVAGSSMRAELRDTHTLALSTSTRLNDMEARITESLTEVTSLVGANSQTLAEHRTILNEIFVGVVDVQFGEAMNFLRPKKCPKEALQKQQALSKRCSPMFSAQFSDMPYIITSISDWIALPVSSLLILQAGPRAETRAKQIATELISLLQPTAKQTCWYLSDVAVDSAHATLTEVLRSLASQLIALDPTAMAKHLGKNFFCTKVRGYHTDKEWADFISLILRNLSECFVIVEAEDVYKVIKKDASQLSQFRAVFQRIVDNTLDACCKCKVLLICYGTKREETGSSPHSSTSHNKIVSVRAPVPIPARLRHGRPRSPFDHPAWKSLISQNP